MTGRKADSTTAAELPKLWRKSSYSPDNGNGQACVEVTRDSTMMVTRDSKLGNLSPLMPLTDADYTALLNQIK